MKAVLPDLAWEAMFSPYDQDSYQAVLDQLEPKDVVLDIGAGDLRLDRQMAQIARKVYAVERNAYLLEQAVAALDAPPANLIPICADARLLEFPTDITTGVLMMRHCTCFRRYADALRLAGAARLITNARWRMSVEVVNLSLPRRSYAEPQMGWYACLCGGTGFKEGPAEHWSSELDRIVQEVFCCPQCMERSSIEKNMSF